MIEKGRTKQDKIVKMDKQMNKMVKDTDGVRYYIVHRPSDQPYQPSGIRSKKRHHKRGTEMLPDSWYPRARRAKTAHSKELQRLPTKRGNTKYKMGPILVTCINTQ